MAYVNRDVPNWTVGESYTQLIGAILKHSTNCLLNSDIIGYYNDLMELFNSSPFVFSPEEKKTQREELEKIGQDIMFKEERRNELGETTQINYTKRKEAWKSLGDKKSYLIEKIYNADLLIPKKKRDNEDDDGIDFFGE